MGCTTIWATRGCDGCLFNSNVTWCGIACESANKVCPSLGPCPYAFPAGRVGHASRADACKRGSRDVERCECRHGGQGLPKVPKAAEDAGQLRFPKTFEYCSPHTVAHQTTAATVARSRSRSHSRSRSLPFPR